MKFAADLEDLNRREAKTLSVEQRDLLGMTRLYSRCIENKGGLQDRSRFNDNSVTVDLLVGQTLRQRSIEAIGDPGDTVGIVVTKDALIYSPDGAS